jgi:hypothetical protein
VAGSKIGKKRSKIVAQRGHLTQLDLGRGDL